jgi:hypothetical protein
MIATPQRHGEILSESALKDNLVALRADTADRSLKLARAPASSHGKTAKPRTLLKHQIPIRTFSEWDEKRPGYFVADLVAQCAETASCEFVHTLRGSILHSYGECSNRQKNYSG